MPAILLEMAVFSEPGTVEFLPAMPASLNNGALDGVWLYTWAKLERMSWDETCIRATLQSHADQTLTLRCRRPFTAFRVNGKTIPPQGNAMVPCTRIVCQLL